MTEPEVPDNVQATARFPQFGLELYQMIFAEVEGLTEEQLDFESDQEEWSKWSVL
jgi:hypothetical protein